MLTVFHTADWHLGQSFQGFDREYEHQQFLDWLLQTLKDHRPNALIIAGDIFDSINPSASSQRRFYNFLAAAHGALPSMQIVITAGNHDAAARLEAPAVVLNSLNIAVVGTVTRNEQGEIELQRFLIPLQTESGEVAAIALAVPFLRPSDVPMLPNAADPYLDGIRELYGRITDAARIMRTQHYPNSALLAMGHCHVQGGEESNDSERRLVIGGAEALGVDTFSDDIAYVALGHLHKAQKFQGGRIRYSGSPIPLSFSESTYEHRVLKLTFGDDELLSVEDLMIPRSVPLTTIPESGAMLIEDVLPMLQVIPPDKSLLPDEYPFLEVRIQNAGPDPTRRKRIEEALEGKPVRLASIKVDYAEKTSAGSDSDTEYIEEELSSISPEDIFLNAHLESHGIPASDALIQAFREIAMQETHTS